MVVLGLTGAAGVGKDSIADYLVARYGFVKFAFSDALYKEVADAFGLEDESLLRDRETKELVTHKLATGNCQDAEFSYLVERELMLCAPEDAPLHPEEIPYSPRQILQWWGTDYRRAQNEKYWIDAAERWMFAYLRQFRYGETRPQHFVISAVRFENERDYIREYPHSNIWHVYRDAAAPVHGHISEAPLALFHGEREIFNNHTIGYLHKGIDQLMQTGARYVRMEPMAPAPVEQDDAPVRHK